MISVDFRLRYEYKIMNGPHADDIGPVRPSNYRQLNKCIISICQMQTFRAKKNEITGQRRSKIQVIVQQNEVYYWCIMLRLKEMYPTGRSLNWMINSDELTLA
jgi:hypothetical protein